MIAKRMIHVRPSKDDGSNLKSFTYTTMDYKTISNMTLSTPTTGAEKEPTIHYHQPLEFLHYASPKTLPFLVLSEKPTHTFFPSSAIATSTKQPKEILRVWIYYQKTWQHGLAIETRNVSVCTVPGRIRTLRHISRSHTKPTTPGILHKKTNCELANCVSIHNQEHRNNSRHKKNLNAPSQPTKPRTRKSHRPTQNHPPNHPRPTTTTFPRTI